MIPRPLSEAEKPGPPTLTLREAEDGRFVVEDWYPPPMAPLPLFLVELELLLELELKLGGLDEKETEGDGIEFVVVD
jgi:hypothetical protein